MPCCESAPALVLRPERCTGRARAWGHVSRSRLLRELLLALVMLVALAGLAPSHASEGSAQIEAMRIDREDGQLLLSTQLNLKLSTEVQDALSRGIAITFVAEAELARNRWYWYDKPLTTAMRYMRLSYQPLTRRWRLVVSAQPFSQAASTAALGQNFDSLDEALGALRRLSRWRIAALSDLEADAGHNVTLRFRLDQASLPRPFQLSTVTLEEWRISASRSQKVPD